MPPKKIIGSGQSGQIVLEYVLLLIIAVAVASLMTTLMVNRNPNNPGFIVAKWMAILKTVGNDTADDVGPVN
jgi:hypothetical protein